MGGWTVGGRPLWEVTHLRRAVTGNSVPLPRTLLKLVLSLVVPRLLIRLLLTMLPVELGTYILGADQTLYLAGEPLHACLPLVDVLNFGRISTHVIQ